MKNGIHSFTFRELSELERRGVSFVLYPTKAGKGPYLPYPHWKVHYYNVGTLLWSFVVFAFRRPRQLLEALVEATRFRGLIDLIISLDFSRNMLEERIGRIHCHFGDHKFFIGHFCKMVLGLPLSVTIHAYELYNNPNPRLFERALVKTNEVITISEYNKRVLEEACKVPSEKIHVVRLFTDKGLDEEISQARSDPFSILMVSRFVEKKGHKTLFEAIARLQDSDLRLQVVGDGPLDLRSLAKEIGILDKVEFLGNVSDGQLRELYRECNVFCLPSETPDSGDKEGIPVVLMEAMAFGKPVISTRHAGIPELVKEILVDERDASSLADGIRLLMDDEELRMSLGKKNREIIRKKYSSENVDELLRVFKGDGE
ncbi:MAG: glycosyltransferase family 4 protein [Thermoplasmata archaeon]